ncbi:MAG: glycine zipper family protein [Dehalogenimonas sp.]
MAKRIELFSASCSFCSDNGEEYISGLISSLNSYGGQWQRNNWKNYSQSLDHIVKHLKEVHHLSEEGEYTGMWMALGTGIGVALGAAIDNVGAGIAIGVGIGLAIGSLLEAGARKQSRML